jgi:demethylmenaquinone methyltransferase/2-methoxy-6-polyprenyl-1,4-benzoquinol methylase
MDPDLRARMLRYYDERAPDYEEAYVLGTGRASIADPRVFQVEAARLADVVERFAHGRLLDLACGSGHWLPHYAQRCSRIVLFDQSERMLDECRKKVTAQGVADRCTFVQGDFLDHQFEPRAYDCALVGFFLSHLTEEQERLLFDVLRRTLAPGGRFLILDSAWTPARTPFTVKVGRQERRLRDGTRFDIYKRYCDQGDIEAWATTYGVTISVEHFGDAFFAVSGSFQ